jgi:hypothetical protein
MRMPVSIQADLPGVAPASLGPVLRVAAVWQEAVGEALARVSQPARVARDGVLVVHAADAAWVHAITLERRTILRRLDEQLGGAGPSDLRVEVGPISVVEAVPETPPTEVLPEARARAEEIAAGVEGEALRAALERAIAASLSRPKTP